MIYYLKPSQKKNNFALHHMKNIHGVETSSAASLSLPFTEVLTLKGCTLIINYTETKENNRYNARAVR